MTDLRQALLGAPRARVRQDDLRRMFADARPELTNRPEFRELLRAELDRLAAEGVLRMPGGRRSNWDSLGTVALPRFVTVVRPKAERQERRAVSWVPLLAWASEERDRRTLELLERLNGWLASRTGPPRLIPEKERALEIFGDEKAISRRLANGKFMGRVDLADIGAVRVSIPLAHELPSAPATGRPVLVVENAGSYWSLARWNDGRGAFSAIAYGRGNELTFDYTSMDAVVQEAQGQGIEYLGDIDPRGLGIPATLDAERRDMGLEPLRPCEPFYAWLLRHGARLAGSSKDASQWLGWMPEGLRAKTADLLDAELRIPQESLSLDVLEDAFDSFRP